MRISRKSLVVVVSTIAFVLVLPIHLVQNAVKKLAGKGKLGISFVYEVYAEVFYTVENALKALLPEAKDIKEEVKTLNEEQKKSIAKAAQVEFGIDNDTEYHFYTSSAGTAVLYTVKGKWGPIKFMLAFDKEGKIKDLVVLELTERRGRPVKDRKFLEQYIGKSKADPIKLKKDIKGIAGATISSRQMTDGIRKLVYVYDELCRK